MRGVASLQCTGWAYTCALPVTPVAPAAGGVPSQRAKTRACHDAGALGDAHAAANARSATERNGARNARVSVLGAEGLARTRSVRTSPRSHAVRGLRLRVPYKRKLRCLLPIACSRERRVVDTAGTVPLSLSARACGRVYQLRQRRSTLATYSRARVATCTGAHRVRTRRTCTAHCTVLPHAQSKFESTLARRREAGSRPRRRGGGRGGHEGGAASWVCGLAVGVEKRDTVEAVDMGSGY